MTVTREYGTKAQKLIPGGAHTYSRGEDQYPQNAPSVLLKGEGAYVWDLDGNKYLDYGMGLRSVTVGYGYKRIADAALAQINMGNGLPRPSKVEVDAAEAMIDLIDGIDMVKFAKNGSSVTSAATKLARAYTGRKYIARCAEHPFFSYDDWFIGSTVVDAGIPSEIKQLTLQFHFNDMPSLQALFDQYPEQIACVILEPATAVEPRDGYLNDVKALCQKHGSVFILDEMITGFRWHLNGAQKYYGVVPDMATFGKGMANGFSVSALVGKREIMELGGLSHDKERVFLISTTHGAEMSGLGALLETLHVYKELDVVGHHWRYGRRLVDGMNALSKEMGIQDQFYLEGVSVSPNYICKDKNGDVSLPLRTLFAQEMIKGGVMMPYIALSLSHGDIELEMTLEATKRALLVYRQALENGVDGLLVGPAIKPVFRRYN